MDWGIAFLIRDDAPIGGAIAPSRGDQPDTSLPTELAKPARRALANAGYTRLDQLTTVTEAEIAKFHGMGPKALAQLRRALAADGKTFADAS